MATQSSNITVYLNLPRPAEGAGLLTDTTQLQPSPVDLLLVPDNKGSELPPARRLLVLVPGSATPAHLANRVWSLAAGKELDVLFIGAAQDGDDEYVIRRLLATLAAATRDSRLRVETRLVRGKNWLKAIQLFWQPDDLIICHSEQTIMTWGFRRRPLAQTLVLALNAPVYVLTGFCPELPSGQPGSAGRWLRSLLPFLIIAGFFVLQALIKHTFTNWLYYPLMILSIFAELGLLAIWH